MLSIIYFPYNSEKSAKLKKKLQLQLMFMYKVVEGRVPAINEEHYLKSQRRKGTVRAKQYTDFVTTLLIIQCAITQSVSNQFKPELRTLDIYTSSGQFMIGTTGIWTTKL